MFRYCSGARTRNDALLPVPGTQSVICREEGSRPEERPELRIVSPEMPSAKAIFRWVKAGTAIVPL